MATPRTLKPKKGKYELEVEKLRSEGQWNKALELIASHGHDRSNLFHFLNHLILCETKLEGNDQGEITVENLLQAKDYATDIVKSTDEQYKTEGSILLGKIFFLQNDLKSAFDTLSSLNLTSIKIEPITLRLAHIVSEGLAILGLISEEFQLQKHKKLSKVDRDNIIMLYSAAGQIFIRHVQDLERNQSEHSGAVIFLSPVVEKAILKIPLLLYEDGDITGAISKFRLLLSYNETFATRSLRQNLGLKFAELLLHSTCTKFYQKFNPKTDYEMCSTTDNNVIPHQYPLNRFIPDNRLEEAILVLMIAEHIASQDVILNRPSECSENQILRSHNDACAIYDMLTIALIKVGHSSFLSKCLERALKFSYEQFHMWYKFALSLINSKQHYRGYLGLKECLRIDNKNISVYLLASSLCLGYLNFIEEGMEMALDAIRICDSSEWHLMSRAHLLVGWGWSILARNCLVTDKRVQLQDKAVNEYKIASQLDPDDYLVWYHLAVEQATQRRLDEALSSCQKSLQLMPTHSNTLCLLALLHTAGGKRMEQASKALYVGLNDRPNDFNMLFILAKVERVRLGPKAGLKIYRRLLEVWRDTFVTNAPATLNGKSRANLFTTDDQTINSNSNMLSPMTVGTNTIPPSLELDDDSYLSNFCDDINHLELALTNIAIGNVGQTGTSIAPNTKLLRAHCSTKSLAAKIQVKIYYGLAETYFATEQLLEAKEALDEAVKVAGLNHHTLYLLGCLAEKQGNLCRARSLYESVIALKGNHIEALLSLASLLCRSNQLNLAERATRDAMNVDPTSFNVWRLLADILSSSHTSESASDTVVAKALSTAIELEQTEPIEPFHSLPLGVRCT